MHPRLCVHGLSSRAWSVDEDLAFYAASGIHTVTVPYTKLEADPVGGVKRFADSGLRPAALSGGAATGLAGGLEAVRQAIDTAVALGAPSFYSVAGATAPNVSTDAAFEALVSAVRPAARYAADAGISLAIEANSVTTRNHGFVHTLSDCIDLAVETDVAICVEFQNCWYERGLARQFRDAVDRFSIVQVSDFVVGETLKLNRRVPGDGDMPLDWLIGEVLEAGYSGVFDIEILGPAIEEEGYANAIRRSIDWMGDRLGRWGV